jgi:hypothetical protein
MSESRAVGTNQTTKTSAPAIEELEWRLGTTIEGLPDAAAILTYED